MSINNHSYNKFSNLHNFLFHPLYDKKKAGLAIASNIFMSVFSLGVWQIPFWIVNCLDKKKLKKGNNSKLNTVSGKAFQALSGASTPKSDSHSASTTLESSQKQKSSLQHALSKNNTPTPPATIQTVVTPPPIPTQPATPQAVVTPPSVPTQAPTPTAPAVVVATQIPTVTQTTMHFPKLLSLPKADWMKPANTTPCFLDSFLLSDFCDPGFMAVVPPSALSSSSEQVIAIQERIAVLNDAIQLEERYKKLKDPLLIVKDILVAWEDSPAKYALMMDGELLELKASDVPKLSSFKLIASRMKKLITAQQMSVDQDTLTPANVQDMLIVDMAHLNGKTLNRLGQHVPPAAFFFISPNVVPELEFNSLTKKQLNMLFSSKERVHKLTIAQVNSRMPEVSVKLLQNLRDEQVLGLDFTKIDEGIFSAIFDQYSVRTKKLLSKMLDTQIIALKPFLKPAWHQHLSDHQKSLIA